MAQTRVAGECAPKWSEAFDLRVVLTLPKFNAATNAKTRRWHEAQRRVWNCT